MYRISTILLALSLLHFSNGIAQQKPGNLSPEVGRVIALSSDFMSRSAYDSAAFVLNEAFSQTDVTYSDVDLYYLLSYEAEIMYYNALFDLGLSSALRGLEIANAMKNDTLIGSSENLVGLMFMSMDKHDVALGHFRNAIGLIRYHEFDYLSYGYQVLANAAECFLKLQMPDSAFAYARMGLEETRQLKRIRGEAIIHWTLAEAWLQKQEFDSAKTSVEQALQLVDSTQHRDLVVTLYTTNMRIFAGLKDKASLFEWMDRGLIELDNSYNTDFARSDFLETASDLCIEFNALEKGGELMRSWKLLQKNLTEKQQNQRLLTLKDYYEKNQRLALAKEQDAVQKRQIELQNTRAVFLGILSVLLVILIPIVFIYFRQRHRISKLEHKEQLRKNELEFEMRAIENRIMAISEERNRIASDLHDDIGASLSSIRIYSGAAQKKFHDDPAESMRLIERINLSSSGMMDRMSDIVWSINPKNDNVESIVFRMKSQAGEVLDPLDIEVDYAIDKNAEKIQPTMTARRNIYLIYKEAINNIAKYAGCRQVHVQLRVLDEFLWLVIQDDGAGFDLNHPKLGNGLNSMRQRAETLGGSLLIRSEIAKGTELRASFEIATISDRMPG